MQNRNLIQTDVATTDVPGSDEARHRFEFEGKHYALECIDSYNAILQMRDDWIDLELRCPEKFTYFQTYDWCSKWSEVHAECPEDSDINVTQIYVLRSAEPDDFGKLLMIWPLFKTKSRAGIKVLITLGEPLGQYSGILFDAKTFSAKLGGEVVEQICSTSTCDAFTLNYFPGESMLSQILGDKGFSDKGGQKSMILDLEGMESWEAYRDTLPKNHKKQRNRRKNKLSKLGELTYDIMGPEHPEFKKNIHACIELKQIWMQETGRRKDVMSDPSVAAVLSSLGDTETADAHDSIFVHVLALDGKPIAFEVGMAFKGHYYSFLGAIDLQFHKFSPGKVQLEMAQKWAKENGFKKFDFLNDPSDYKAHWTNEVEPLHSKYVPITPSGYLYCWMWKTAVKPKLKELYQNFKPEDRRYFNQLFDLVGKLQGVGSR